MGKLEPISPVSPVHMDPDLDLVPARFSKEELIQNMDRVDREITMVEQQISKLRKKQVSAPKQLLETGFAWGEIQQYCSLRHPHTRNPVTYYTPAFILFSVLLFCTICFFLNGKKNKLKQNVYLQVSMNNSATSVEFNKRGQIQAAWLECCTVIPSVLLDPSVEIEMLAERNGRLIDSGKIPIR